jgi:uncharacterized protein YceK
MKTRKLLPLVVLAVGALFLLSGCDALLDAIFPTNQIQVQVSAYKNSGPDYLADWGFQYNSIVTLTLYDITDGSQTTTVTSWDGIDSNYLYFNFTYTSLKDHTYTLTAMYHSASSGFNYSQTFFSDPHGLLMNAISLPYRNSGDSTGRSVNLYMQF